MLGLTRERQILGEIARRWSTGSWKLVRATLPSSSPEQVDFENVHGLKSLWPSNYKADRELARTCLPMPWRLHDVIWFWRTGLAELINVSSTWWVDHSKTGKSYAHMHDSGDFSGHVTVPLRRCFGAPNKRRRLSATIASCKQCGENDTLTLLSDNFMTLQQSTHFSMARTITIWQARLHYKYKENDSKTSVTCRDPEKCNPTWQPGRLALWLNLGRPRCSHYQVLSRLPGWIMPSINVYHGTKTRLEQKLEMVSKLKKRKDDKNTQPCEIANNCPCLGQRLATSHAHLWLAELLKKLKVRAQHPGNISSVIRGGQACQCNSC